MVNVPVAQNAALRLAFASLTNDGYYTNALTGGGLNRKDSQTARGTFLWEPTDAISVFVAADYSHDNSGNQVGTPFNTSTAATATTPIYGDYFKAAPDIPDTDLFDGGGTSVQVDWNTGYGTATSITAYRQMSYDQADDLGASPVGNDLARTLQHQQFSQELEFKSQLPGPISFTSGLFYFLEDSDEDLIFEIPLSGPTYTTTTPVTKLDLPYIAKQKSQSFAGYTEVNYQLLDNLVLTAGGRYTFDTKDIQRHGTRGDESGSADFYNFSPKGNIDYHITKDISTYATISKGYKAGVYQPFPSAQTATSVLAPEKVLEYEGGVKSEFFNDRLIVDAAVFDAFYTNLQIGLLATNGTVFAASADLHSTGAEVEFTAIPIDGLTINGQIAQDHTHFTRAPEGPTYP